MSKFLFVLGAGASQPYGYPTGAELKWKIINDFINGHGITFDLLKHEFAAEPLKNFALAFRASKLNSIDAFLRMNKDFELIGKKAIAAIILHAQSTSNLDPSGKDWFGYLYNRLIGTEEEKLDNPDLSFITFNYDHCLEYQLYNAFKHSFNLSDEDTKKAFNKVKIHHVYGEVGEFASPLNKAHNLAELFHYHNNVRARAIDEASKSIKVMYDQRTGLSEETKSLLGAENIYFLGFGFDKLNIERLGVNWKSLNRLVRVSGYGITDTERAAYIRNMGIHPNHIQFGHTSWDCYSFLRERFA